MRKHFFTFFYLLITTIFAHAQTEKGSQLIGGFLSLTTGKGTTTYYGSGAGSTNDISSNKLNTVEVGPSYSYFLASNLDLGGSAGYSSQKETGAFSGEGTDLKKQNGYNYAIYLRKYFLYENKVGFRIGPYASYQSMKSFDGNATSAAGPVESRNKNFNAGIGFDFVFFPTRKLGLAATLGSLRYSREIYSELEANQLTYEEKDHTFGLNLSNSNLALSVFYSFGK